ncbi:hypothetical protein [Chitinophaga deserti]|uniref:hypothetical protein n=1 Tax=Chitinophaga deserti TaxID=2164099 RepID=UPI0018E512C6|nr:hypothetical protein [Chitinophaga deserti]
MKHMKRYTGLKIAGFIALGVGFVTLLGFGIMMLWNWLIPELFNGPVINFWQALGLFILSKLLFGGFPKDHDKGGWKKRKWERMQAKMEHMSPEEKEKLKSHFDRCGWGKRWQPEEGQTTERQPE